VVRLHYVKVPAHSDHTVRSAIRLEIVGLRIGGGMRLIKRAQVCDWRPGAVLIDADDAIRHLDVPMRASGTVHQRVEVSINELDVGDAADQT